MTDGIMGACGCGEWVRIIDSFDTAESFRFFPQCGGVALLAWFDELYLDASFRGVLSVSLLPTTRIHCQVPLIISESFLQYHERSAIRQRHNTYSAILRSPQYLLRNIILTPQYAIPFRNTAEPAVPTPQIQRSSAISIPQYNTYSAIRRTPQYSPQYGNTAPQ